MMKLHCLVAVILSISWAPFVASLRIAMDAPETRKYPLTREAEESDGESDAALNIPQNGRIAVLVRGQAFRHGRFSKGCNPNETELQIRATESLVRHIAEPLEDRNNTVEFFVLDGNGKSCSAFESLLPKYGNRVASFSEGSSSPSQAANYRDVLEIFKTNAGDSSQIASKYDLIIIVRHDNLWKRDLDKSRTADFKKFNFFSPCEAQAHWVENCAADNFHMMPGSFFEGFDSQIGKTNCFELRDSDYGPWTHGHGCWNNMAKTFGEENLTFIRNERPTQNVRESNEVMDYTFEILGGCKGGPAKIANFHVVSNFNIDLASNSDFVPDNNIDLASDLYNNTCFEDWQH